MLKAWRTSSSLLKAMQSFRSADTASDLCYNSQHRYLQNCHFAAFNLSLVSCSSALVAAINSTCNTEHDVKMPPYHAIRLLTAHTHYVLNLTAANLQCLPAFSRLQLTAHTVIDCLSYRRLCPWTNDWVYRIAILVLRGHMEPTAYSHMYNLTCMMLL